MPLLAAFGILITACLPSFAGDAFSVGCQHYRQGKFPLAKAFFAKAVQDEPTSINARYQLANTLYHLGEYDRAIGNYNACLHLGPDQRMRSFCLAAVAQIQNLKKAQTNKVATNSTSSATIKQY